MRRLGCFPAALEVIPMTIPGRTAAAAVFLVWSAVLASPVLAEASRLVSIGEQTLDVAVRGTGGPTIVLESGLGYGHAVWAEVADELSRTATVVSYSRAGHGRSPPSILPRTVEQIAGELELLLTTLQLDPPYVLVGHSAGGFYIRKYAELYPSRVSGLVFVDPTPERILISLRELDEPRARQEEALMASMTPERVKPEDLYFSKITDAGEFAVSSALPDVPTALITAMKREHPQFMLHSVEGKEIWLALHEDLLSRFSDRLHMVSSASGHNVHHDQPELVVAAVRYVMRQTTTLAADVR
jgi:pimeloyl-ACP methyl ester carboxylesterase